MRGWRSTTAQMFCTAQITEGAKQIPASRRFTMPGVVVAAGTTPVMFDSGVRDATDVIIALALGATAVGPPYAYALSYGGTESLTHYLQLFLAELDLTMAICGFKDIASLRQAGCEAVMASAG